MLTKPEVVTVVVCLWVCAGMGGRVPTWRMVEGSSSESLALDVALQCQVPPEIVLRAAHLFKVLTPLKTSCWPIQDNLERCSLV